MSKKLKNQKLKIAIKLIFFGLMFFVSAFMANRAYADLMPTAEVIFDITYENQPIVGDIVNIDCTRCIAYEEPCANGHCEYTVFVSKGVEYQEFTFNITLTGDPLKSGKTMEKFYKSDKKYKILPIFFENTSHFNINLKEDGKMEVQSSGAEVITTSDEISNLITNIKGIFIFILIPIIITVLVELLIWFIFIKIYRLSKRILISVIVLNIITVFVVLAFNYNFIYLILSEIIVFLVEGFFVYLFNRKRINLSKSIYFSFVANTITFLLSFIVNKIF